MVFASLSKDTDFCKESQIAPVSNGPADRSSGHCSLPCVLGALIHKLASLFESQMNTSLTYGHNGLNMRRGLVQGATRSPPSLYRCVLKSVEVY